MTATPIDSPDDLQWARDVHNVPEWARFIILHGTEDAPDRIEVWRDAEPRYDAPPDAVLFPDLPARFFAAYVECALWASTDNDGPTPLDENYDADDIDPAALAEMRADCEAFIESERADLDATGGTPEQHGHDFFLTRNRHGAGFWDRGYGPAGDRLTAAAHAYGSADLYVGDDGKVHVA